MFVKMFTLDTNSGEARKKMFVRTSLLIKKKKKELLITIEKNAKELWYKNKNIKYS